MGKLNKKFLIFLGGIVGITFLIIIIVASFRACNRKTNNYSSVEKKMVEAARKYYRKNKDKTPDISENTSITAAELASGGFMKSLSEILIDSSCTGTVSVYNNGGLYQLIPDLQCAEYQTEHLADKIIKDNLVSSSTDGNEEVESEENNNSEYISRDYPSGLYYDDGVYVFKGKDPNNYVQFAKTKWRIIDIDSNGVMRVIKNDAEQKQLRWDTKFNSEANRSYGINDYKNSLILEELNGVYNNLKDKTKVHFMPFDVCVGKRDSKDISIDRNVDCSTLLEKQYISLISVVDFARASLDENCDSVLSGSCRNYNYLSSVASQTWTTTALSNNTYKVIYISSGAATSLEARASASYNRVIALNGKELYNKGKGTLDEPYIID